MLFRSPPSPPPPPPPHPAPLILTAFTDAIYTKYTPGRLLGQGAFGTVFECTERADARRHFACKIIHVKKLLATRDGPNVVGRIRNEVAIMSYLAGHPNVVRLHDLFETEGFIFIVQELCPEGSLRSHLHRMGAPLGESQAAGVFRCILKSVLHCHQMGILHRDVKLENFMVSGNTIKLADFGLASFYRRNEPQVEAVGSPSFMAPETLSRTGYGPESDVWSCGVCLFHILSDDLPFKGTTPSQVFTALRGTLEADFSSLAWRTVSPEARDLTRRLLQKQPGARLRIQDALAHPWMRHSAGIRAPTSSRVFLPPEDLRARTRVHGFIDAFKHRVERAYVTLLQAPNAAGVARAWRGMRTGLRELNAYMAKHASPDGPYFAGADPGLAEAATVPSLHRMCVTLPALRNVSVLRACDAMRLTAVARWMRHALQNRAACSDVSELPVEVYVQHARQLFVAYEGPLPLARRRSSSSSSRG